jgi:hypothetical protein
MDAIRALPSGSGCSSPFGAQGLSYQRLARRLASASCISGRRWRARASPPTGIESLGLIALVGYPCRAPFDDAELPRWPIEAGPETGAHVESVNDAPNVFAARPTDRSPSMLPAASESAVGARTIRARLTPGQRSGATTLRPVAHARRWTGKFRWQSPHDRTLVVSIIPESIAGRRCPLLRSSPLGEPRLRRQISGIEVPIRLDLAGVLADLIPEEQSGRFTVRELVDRSRGSVSYRQAHQRRPDYRWRRRPALRDAHAACARAAADIS